MASFVAGFWTIVTIGIGAYVAGYLTGEKTIGAVISWIRSKL